MSYLNLPHPHGFLIWRGKQTAIVSDELLDGNKFLIVTDDDAFGEATLGKPAAMTIELFDSDTEAHCCKTFERKLRWPDAKSLYVYPVKHFKGFEHSLLFQDGDLINYMPDKEDQRMIKQASDLPSKIILDSSAVCVGDGGIGFDISKLVEGSETLKQILQAVYGTEVSKNDSDKSLNIYQLALVRNPKLIVKKKETIALEVKQMPWEIREDFEDCAGFAVVKVDNDELEGCHETVAEAEAQLTALNIAEAEDEDENAAHPDDDEDEDKREEDDEEDKDEHQLEIREAFAIVDGEEMLSCHLDLETAEAELKEIIAMIEDGPEVEDEEMSTEEKAGKRLNAAMLKRLKDAWNTIKDLMSWSEYQDKDFTDKVLSDKGYGIAIKEVNGEPWIITWSSNAFEDRDKEIISTKALEQWSERANQKTEKGFFNFWHIKDSDFAKKEWSGVPGRILVEAGPFLKDEKGQKALEFFKHHLDGHNQIAPEGWGCSIEFKFLPDERQTGVFENVEISRTSVLPRFAAANIHTQVKELVTMSMSDDQRKAALVVFGEALGTSLLAGAESKSVELEANIAHKDEQSKETKPEEITIEAIVSHMNVGLEPINEALAKMAEVIVGQGAKIQAMEKQEAIKTGTEMPKFLFQAMRASDANKTTVPEGDDLLTRKPQETNQEASVASSFFGGK